MDVGMRRLRQTDIGHRRDDHAPLKLALTTWFWAAYMMATHSNGISALQLQRQLALGSYRSAWLLCGKLRRSIVAPGRSTLAGLVEIDETEIPCRSRNDRSPAAVAAAPRAKCWWSALLRSRTAGPGPVASVWPR